MSTFACILTRSLTIAFNKFPRSQPTLKFLVSEQKIHGHPEYIETEFPLTDKFIECHVKRLEGGEFGGVMERDPEERERERNLRRKEKKPKIPDDQRHRDLRNPGMFQTPKKLLKEQQQQQANEPATPAVIATVVVVILVLGIIYVLVKGRRKIQSKTN